MKDKQQLLAELKEALRSGVLSEADILPFVRTASTPQLGLPQTTLERPQPHSVVDVMFYVAGIVFFVTVMSIIVQSWSDENPLTNILLSAGTGALLWGIVYYLLKNQQQTDIRQGLTNTLLLTGSLLLIVGGYIITNEIVGGYGDVNFIPIAVAFLLLSGIHLAFDRLIRKDLLILLGVLLGVAAFTALLFGFLQQADAAMDIWAFVVVLSGGLLAYATRVVARVYPDRTLTSRFDFIAAFIALGAMYMASFGDYGVVWLTALIASVFGIFYLSIVAKNQQLLVSGSFFLVLAVVMLSFKYFSGFGATASLIVATMGLLGSAAIASSIHRRYFKQTAPQIPQNTVES